MYNDDAPGLGVGFQIDFGDSFGGLKTLDDLIGTVQANAVREFQRIEAAVSGGLGLSQAAQEFRKLTTESAAATREMRSVAAENARVERATEGMIRTLERQNAEFGKSRTEIQATRMAQQADAAEKRGLTEVAGRLRTELALLAGQQAAARAAAEAEAQAMRDAAFAHGQFEAAARRGMVALRETEAAAARDAAAVARLREMLDPAAAAQARLNAEMEEATRVLRAVGASEEEVTRAHHALAGGVGRVGTAAKLSRGDMLNLGYQINDIVVSLISGQKPFMVFAQQGAQIGQIATTSGVGMGGMARAIGGLLAGFAPLIAVAGVAVGGLALFDRAVSKGVDTKAMVAGLGLTHAEIKRLKDVSVDSGDVIKATFQVLAKSVGLDMSDMKKSFGDALDWMTTAGRKYLAVLLGQFAGTFSAISAIVKGVFAGKGISEILADAGAAFTGEVDKMDKRLGRFGASVTAQIRSNKLKDLQKQADEIKKDRTPKKDTHAEQLAREAAATEAQIAGLYKLADAYGVSGGAALIAEAQMKATTAAIKKQGDIEEFVARQVRLSIAQRVADAAKASAAMRDQARVQTEINGMVAAGTVPAERANEIMQQRIAELPLLDALEAARTVKDLKGIAEVTKALDVMRSAQLDADAASIGARFVADDTAADHRLAELEAELRLVGATDAVRTHELATIRATNEAIAKGYKGQQIADYVAKQVQIADGTQAVADATRNLNDALTYTADRWDIIASKVQSAASGMADAFGGVGRAIGDMASVYATFQADRERAEVEHQARIKAAGKDQVAIARENQLFALRSSGAQIEAFGDMASAAKGFFKEGSVGYRTLAAVEKAYRTVQFAMSVQAMIQNAAETFGFVTNSAAKATAAGAEGIATQSKLPFPANIAAMAATAAALVAAGIAIVGGGGGGGRAAPVTNTGTGTVLGDGSAKSDSIKNAIDALKEVDTLMLTTSRTMAASLRSIDSQIGGLASVLVRSGNISADDQVTQGFKMNAVGSVLSKIPLIGGILGGLFGTKTTVLGSGLYGGGQSVGSILGGGFDAQTYSDVEKKKKLFGITTSTKTSTVYGGAVDTAVSDQFALIIRSFNDAIVAAAAPLGATTSDIEAKVSGFVVTLGKIDLSGLTGTEIQEKLTAVFGAAADQMAAGAFPGIDRFQKVGEGAFETLVRVASTVEQVTASLTQLGAATAGLGIDAKMGLAAQFDSISDLTNAVGSYFDAFYTPAEQNAARLAQLGTVFTSLGVGMPATLASFRQLVEAQDLTTAAGQATYATLLQLAPAFADLKKEMDSAKSAADILSERQDLQRKLLELNGDTAAIRALDLAKLDASNRTLQEQIYAVQDAQTAAAAAKTLADAWASVGDSIMDEVKRIRGLTDVGGSGTFASLMGQFNAATASARGGDQDAAKLLPGLSQSLLKAAADVATSRQELARVQAQTAASLEQTYGVISSLTGTGSSTASTLAAAATASQAAAAPTTANDSMASELRALREEVAAMRSENNRGHADNISATNRGNRVLEAVTADSGGVAVTVASAA